MIRKEYRENEDGSIEEVTIWNGEDIAKKSDVMKYHMKSMAYADRFDSKCKVALVVSATAIVISIIAIIMAMLF